MDLDKVEVALPVSSSLWALITNIRRDGQPWAGRRILVGELALSSPVVSIPETATSDKDPGRLEQHLALVWIEPRGLEDLDSEDELRHEPVDGLGHLNMTRDRGNWPLTVTIWVPEERFSQLWDAASSDLTLQLRADLIGSNYLTPLRRNADYTYAELKNVRLLLGRGDFSNEYFQTLRQRHLTAAWSGLHYGGNSQAQRILRELAESAATNTSFRHPIEQQQLNEHVNELISNARSTFRQSFDITSGRTSNAWWLSRAEFDEVLKDYDEAKQKKLRDDYDFYWKHFPLDVIIAKGEQLVGSTAAGLKCNRDELDDLAHKLLSRPGVHSPTLEWALIDALVHVECLGFAQYMHSNETFLGQRVAVPLKPRSGSFEIKQALKEMLKELGGYVFEVVKIGATYAIASMLTSSDSQSTWVVTTGVTVARWLRKAIWWKEINQVKQPGGELFRKMSTFYELFKRQDFNARLARNQLYHLTSEGAVFSPYVANLLDARIRREEEQIGTAAS